MNIKELQAVKKEVSAVSIFKDASGGAIAIQIMANQEIKEHVSKVPALLLCIDAEETLFPGDFINIESLVKHWVKGIDDSQLILIK
jgi:quercetin dioxygenase-like cupin family protein